MFYGIRDLSGVPAIPLEPSTLLYRLYLGGFPGGSEGWLTIHPHVSEERIRGDHEH